MMEVDFSKYKKVTIVVLSQSQGSSLRTIDFNEPMTTKEAIQLTMAHIFGGCNEG
jgi:hypothetical protein